MATRPTSPTNFADGAGANKQAIPAGIRTDGYPFGSPFPSALYDQREYEIGEWLGYLAALSPASDTLALGRIRATDDPGSTDTFRITDESGTAGVQRWIATQSGSSIRVEVTGGASDASLVFNRATGRITATTGTDWTWAGSQIEIVAMPSLSTSRRFAFSSYEEFGIDLTPANGGWTFQHGTTGSTYSYIYGASAAVSPISGSDTVRLALPGGGATGDVWRRPFYEIESSGCRGGTVWAVKEVSIRVDVEANGNVSLRLCRRNRTTGVESVVEDSGSVDFYVESTTSPTGLTTFTSATAATVLDLGTYSYFFELRTVDLDASSQEIIFAKIIVRKYAAD